MTHPIFDARYSAPALSTCPFETLRCQQNTARGPGHTTTLPPKDSTFRATLGLLPSQNLLCHSSGTPAATCSGCSQRYKYGGQLLRPSCLYKYNNPGSTRTPPPPPSPRSSAHSAPQPPMIIQLKPSMLTSIISTASHILLNTIHNAQTPFRHPADLVAIQGGGDDQVPFPGPPDNDGIHLAIGPRCGIFAGTTADANAGIDSGRIETIVSFGDSYTDGGKSDGSPLDPPILVPPSPLAGGRSTNGLTWVEHVANDVGATIMDYAQSGACIDLSLWPSNPRKVDFLGQVQTFLSQGNNLNPNTTLYSIFFGINDFLASFIDGNHMPQAAQVLLDQIQVLASPPTNARNFMVLDVYGRGMTAPSGEAFKQTIFNSLGIFHETGLQIEGMSEPVQLSVSYVNFENIWEAVLGDNPGFKAFGYVSTDSCTQCTAELGCTTIGMCDDPEHFFYWIPGHPSKETMRIMADYVGEVWARCKV